MKKESNDFELCEDLKELGYHIPKNIKWLSIDAPNDSPTTVICSYLLYKEDPIDVDWGKARLAAKRENEMVIDLTKEESFLEGVRWAVEQIKESK